jgi:hypothetical protein
MRYPTENLYKNIYMFNKACGMLQEIAYKGNVGLHELSKFYQSATLEQIRYFEDLLKKGKIKDAWKFVQNILKVKLIGLNIDI